MTKAKPFLKWVGGKKRLLTKLEEHFPTKYNTYIEPFLGGGSVFFHFQPKKAILSDSNKALIHTYTTISNELETLYTHLQELENKNTEEEYYQYREEFNRLRNTIDFSNTNSSTMNSSSIYYDPLYISALMIYLNKAGYGGVYRENQKGEFNVPYGKYKKLSIANKELLLEVQKSLKNITIQCCNYKETILQAKKGDFIYLDPPYDPEEKTSFTKYQKGDFTREDQKELAFMLYECDKQGIIFVLSNSNTKFIRELYKDFIITEVTVGRHINNKNKSDKVIINNEVIISNCTNTVIETIIEPIEEVKEEVVETENTTSLLLHNTTVLDWVQKKGIFLEYKPSKNDKLGYNKKEKEWANTLLDNTKYTGQWTTCLGETLVKEALTILYKNAWRPEKKEGYKPDWETEDAIYEVKTRNWTTSGTAGEKILGTPYKYSDIPLYYKKPLYIVCVAYQEYEAVERFCIYKNITERKQKILDMWKSMDIHFIQFTELLQKAKIL